LPAVSYIIMSRTSNISIRWCFILPAVSYIIMSRTSNISIRWCFILPAYWKNSLQVDMLLHSVTSSWLRPTSLCSYSLILHVQQS